MFNSDNLVNFASIENGATLGNTVPNGEPVSGDYFGPNAYNRTMIVNGSWTAPGAIFNNNSNTNNFKRSVKNTHNGSTFSGGGSSSSPFNIVIDLGQERVFNMARYYQMFSDGKTTHVALDISSTNNLETISSENWSNIHNYSKLDNNENSDGIEVLFKNTTARYLRLRLYNDGSYGYGNYTELYNFKLFNTDKTYEEEIPNSDEVIDSVDENNKIKIKFIDGSVQEVLTIDDLDLTGMIIGNSYNSPTSDVQRVVLDRNILYLISAWTGVNNAYSVQMNIHTGEMSRISLYSNIPHQTLDPINDTLSFYSSRNFTINGQTFVTTNFPNSIVNEHPILPESIILPNGQTVSSIEDINIQEWNMNFVGHKIYTSVSFVKQFYDKYVFVTIDSPLTIIITYTNLGEVIRNETGWTNLNGIHREKETYEGIPSDNFQIYNLNEDVFAFKTVIDYVLQEFLDLGFTQDQIDTIDNILFTNSSDQVIYTLDNNVEIIPMSIKNNSTYDKSTLRHLILNKMFNNNPQINYFKIKTSEILLDSDVIDEFVTVGKPNRNISLDLINGPMYINLDNINDYININYKNKLINVTKISEDVYSLSGVISGNYAKGEQIIFNNFVLLLGGLLIKNISDTSETFGDPHIKTLTNKLYELPNKQGVYRMVQGNNLIINANTRNIMSEEKNILNKLENNLTHKIVKNGCYYKKLYINCENNILIYNFDEKKIITSNQSYFKIKKNVIIFIHSKYGEIKITLHNTKNIMMKNSFRLNVKYDNELSGLLIDEYFIDTMKLNKLEDLSLKHGKLIKNLILSKLKKL